MQELINGETNKYAKRFYQRLFDEGYELVEGRYRRAKDNVKVKHLECGEIFSTHSDRFINQGSKCPKCADVIRGKTRIMKNQKRFEKLTKKDGYEIVGEYTNSSTQVEVKHVECGYKYPVIPDNFIGKNGVKGTRCPKCHNNSIKKFKIDSTKELQDCVTSHAGESFVVLSEYKGNSKKFWIQHQSKNCNKYKWETTPSNFLKREGNCPVCTGRVRNRSQEYFRKEIYDLVGNEYVPLGEFVGVGELILFRHNNGECDYNEYYVSYDSFVHNGSRCPKCYGNEKLSTEDYKSRFTKLFGDEFIIIGEYINAKCTVEVMHNNSSCNYYTWSPLLRNLTSGKSGCPACSGSKGEKFIYDYLTNNQINFTSQKTYEDLIHKRKLKYDFHLEDYDVLLEFDGAHHFRPIDFASKGEVWAQEQHETTVHRDMLKNAYAIENNISLIRIPYWELEENDLEGILNSVINYFNKNSSINAINNYYVRDGWNHNDYINNNQQKETSKALQSAQVVNQ